MKSGGLFLRDGLKVRGALVLQGNVFSVVLVCREGGGERQRGVVRDQPNGVHVVEKRVGILGLPQRRRWGFPCEFPSNPTLVQGGGGVIVVRGYVRVHRPSGGGNPSRVVCDFSVYHIFRAGREVVEFVEALEEPPTSDLAGGG
jgi:hypothetical protein